MSNMRNKRNTIEVVRTARGWSTKQLAEEMTRAGCLIHHDTVRRHERGSRAVSPIQQVAYAFVLKRRLGELFEGYDGLEVAHKLFDVDDSTLFQLQNHGGGARVRECAAPVPTTFASRKDDR